MTETGFSRSPLLLKGALVRFDAPLLIPIPNIIIFQYNPETLTHTVSPYKPPQADESGNVSQPGNPDESFSLKLVLDATDDLEVGDPIAVVSGVADRKAALELLMYPQSSEDGLLGSLSVSLSGGLSIGLSEPTPRTTVPVTLFVWGPGRVLPVRVTSFSVEEEAFSPILYPVRAAVSLTMEVVKPSAYANLGREPDLSEEIAIAAYKFTLVQKQVLATLNLANTIESIPGMLPF